MEKRVDVLGATAKLQINEGNCGGFRCFCTPTPRVLLPQGWTFWSRRSIADVLEWAVWYGSGLIQRVRATEPAKINWSTPWVSRLWQVETSALQVKRATPTCTYNLHACTDLLGHILIHIYIHACETHCMPLRAGAATIQHLQRAQRYRKRLAVSKKDLWTRVNHLPSSYLNFQEFLMPKRPL